MSKRPAVSLLTLLLACAPKQPGDTASEATGDPSTSSGSQSGTTAPDPTTGTSTGDPTGGSDTVPGTATSSGTDDPPDPTDTADPLPDVGTGQACDLWEEDCPEGQKCAPVSLDGDSNWEQTICVPLAREPAGVNEPCQNLGDGLDGLDTCGEHLMCWNVDPNTGEGVCLGHCTGTPDDPGCADPDAVCQVSAEGVINLCLPKCDPLGDDCPSGQACLPDKTGESFVCIPELSGDEGQVFDACQFINQCDPGLLCVDASLAAQCDPMEFMCCLPFCDLSSPDACPDLDLECIPWFEQGMAPPELKNVGLCANP